MNEEETFKNKTLRFTNNNFVANNRAANDKTPYGQFTANGWEVNKAADNNNNNLDLSNNNLSGDDYIEEDIVTSSQTDTPVLGRKKAKDLNMPPLAPK